MAGNGLAHHVFHPLAVLAVGDGGVGGDDALAPELAEASVHGHHALGAAAGDDAVDLLDLGFADQVADGLGQQHQFKGWAQKSVRGGDQLLGHHGLEHHGQLHPDLLLGVGGKNVDDAVDGVGCPGGVHLRHGRMSENERTGERPQY